jgi:drug/metabolite transporter (DMT)-like permease
MQVYSAPRISLYVVAVGLVVLLPFGLPQLSHVDLRALGGHTWLLLLYSSVGAVVLTNIFWYTGIHRLGPARATVYSYFQPFAGIVFAVGILKEPLSVLQIVGGGTILVGIIFGREPKPEVALTE